MQSLEYNSVTMRRGGNSLDLFSFFHFFSRYKTVSKGNLNFTIFPYVRIPFNFVTIDFIDTQIIFKRKRFSRVRNMYKREN